jgi:hypothetical protein
MILHNACSFIRQKIVLIFRENAIVKVMKAVEDVVALIETEIIHSSTTDVRKR